MFKMSILAVAGLATMAPGAAVADNIHYTYVSNERNPTVAVFDIDDQDLIGSGVPRTSNPFYGLYGDADSASLGNFGAVVFPRLSAGGGIHTTDTQHLFGGNSFSLDENLVKTNFEGTLATPLTGTFKLSDRGLSASGDLTGTLIAERLHDYSFHLHGLGIDAVFSLPSDPIGYNREGYSGEDIAGLQYPTSFGLGKYGNGGFSLSTVPAIINGTDSRFRYLQFSGTDIRRIQVGLLPGYDINGPRGVLELDGSAVFDGPLYDPVWKTGTFKFVDHRNGPGMATSASYFLDIVDSRAPAAVPEPACWTMLIVGFGSIGMVMRRRKSRTSFA